MPTQRLTATVSDGTVDATFVTPEGAGPFPLVVMYADAGGLRDVLTKMGEHLTAKGYAVLQPNPFWRQQPFAPFDIRTVFLDPPERARLMAIVGKVQPAQVIADTEALLAAIDDARVVRDRFATMGYCMGGRLALHVAEAFGDRVVACAPIHAGGLATDKPESPHRHVSALKAATYFAVGDEDPSCTPEHQAALKQALDAAGVRYELEVYAGAKHGFAMPDFPVYDATAAARCWQRVEALFAEHLPPAVGSS